ncbi:sugar transferase [Actomonas aquatica]|uniref:Sugar transferase n=1 Tax=Actomonas aquatica TaxID=2866162 RepID=A0ABZ1CA54_9BACT|nr:sugar transferase [Opitutus sp. WL0086]WRQ88474.1 sugar transferase [Opitutus sp. WL0086]
MTIRRGHLFLLLGLDTLVVFVTFNLLGQLRGILGAGNWLLSPLLTPWVFTVVGLFLIDGYRSRTEMMSADYTSQHFVAIAFALLATLIVSFVLITEGSRLEDSRLVITMGFACVAFLTLSYRRSIHRWMSHERSDRAVLFLGDQASCETFRAACAENEFRQRVIYAYTGDAPPPPMSAKNSEADRLRMYRAVLDEIKSGDISVEAVVLKETASSIPEGLASELTELYFTGVPTFTLELFYETYWRKIPLYRINYVWLFQKGFEIARNPVFERMKRMADVISSALGLVLASPILLAAALAIKFTDGGSVFFEQTRIGRNRVPFQILKLRTMRSLPPADVEAASVPGKDSRYTQENDPRITRVGNFLRKTRIDEVPQLWNVLRGEMSLIGPRAEWDALVADYEEKIPCYHFRHLVRPGITGWAQINYPYGAGIDDTLRKLEYDLYYIRHFSFVMDAAIVLRTIHLMVFGKGR